MRRSHTRPQNQFHVTKRNQAPEDLAREHEMLNTLIESIPDHIYFKDRESRFIRANRALAKAFGRGTQEELLGRTDLDFFTGEHAEQAFADEQDLLEGRRVAISKEEKETWPDGHESWVQTTKLPLHDGSGAIVGTFGISRDITERKRMEQSNAELAAIVESADAAIIRMDSNGFVRTWNKGAEKIYGYSPEEVIGDTMLKVVPSEVAGEYLELLKKGAAGESIHHLETVHLTKSGGRINVMATLSPIFERGEVVIGIAFVVWDITQVKQLEIRLAQAQKLESIGQLAAGIAHEINTPIQYVGDNARFLEDAFADLIRLAPEPVSGHGESTNALPGPIDEGVVTYLKSEVPKAISQLIQGIDQVACIVRAMKEFSHPGPVEKRLIDINRAIESTIVVSRNEWKYVADVTTDLAADLPQVPCVAGEFNQVILNLIVNAAHAIADVVKDSGKKGSIHISSSLKGGSAEIRVSDSGGGIPESIRSKVFDPFFTTKPVGKGTGQGLAIAYAMIVQKHRGVLRFESEPGCGTTFVIQLPLACET